ncbi:MAG: hypothetical protein V3V19_11155 [Cocleimonas sp.]
MAIQTTNFFSGNKTFDTKPEAQKYYDKMNVDYKNIHFFPLQGGGYIISFLNAKLR